jgi:hypothetical protein
MFTTTEHLIISALILENRGISCFQDDVTIDQNFDLAANGSLAVTPHPNTPRVFGGKTLYKATIGGAQFEFEAHDYDQVFNNFLSDDLRGSREADEGHRCFYLCLGRALRIHPFVLASCFRLIAKQLPDILDETQSAIRYDSLDSVPSYNGLVDFMALRYVWVTEFDEYQFSLITHWLQDGVENWSLTIFNEGAPKHCVLFLSRSHYELVPVDDNTATFITNMKKTINDAGGHCSCFQKTRSHQSLTHWLREGGVVQGIGGGGNGGGEGTGGGAEGGGARGDTAEGPGEGGLGGYTLWVGVSVCVSVCVGVLVGV